MHAPAAGLVQPARVAAQLPSLFTWRAVFDCAQGVQRRSRWGQQARASTLQCAAAVAAIETVHTAVQQPRGALHGGAELAVPTSAYVHLPFCKRKCFYCDFPVVATGSRLGSAPVQDAMQVCPRSLPRHIALSIFHHAPGPCSQAAPLAVQAYVDLVCREVAATEPCGGPAPLRTVFFGGGTPSLLPPAQLRRILDARACARPWAEGPHA